MHDFDIVDLYTPTTMAEVLRTLAEAGLELTGSSTAVVAVEGSLHMKGCGDPGVERGRSPVPFIELTSKTFAPCCAWAENDFSHVLGVLPVRDTYMHDLRGVLAYLRVLTRAPSPVERGSAVEVLEASAYLTEALHNLEFGVHAASPGSLEGASYDMLVARARALEPKVEAARSTFRAALPAVRLEEEHVLLHGGTITLLPSLCADGTPLTEALALGSLHLSGGATLAVVPSATFDLWLRSWDLDGIGSIQLDAGLTEVELEALRVLVDDRRSFVGLDTATLEMLVDVARAL